jgi:hypothetical protein
MASTRDLIEVLDGFIDHPELDNSLVALLEALRAEIISLRERNGERRYD